MEYTKTVTTKYKVSCVMRDFCKYTKMFKYIRSTHHNKMDKCHMCDKDFEFGQDVILLLVEGKSNRVCCLKCADKLDEKR